MLDKVYLYGERAKKWDWKKILIAAAAMIIGAACFLYFRGDPEPVPAPQETDAAVSATSVELGILQEQLKKMDSRIRTLEGKVKKANAKTAKTVMQMGDSAVLDGLRDIVQQHGPQLYRGSNSSGQVEAERQLD